MLKPTHLLTPFVLALAACTSSPSDLNHNLVVGAGGPKTWQPQTTKPGFGQPRPPAAPGPPATGVAGKETGRIPLVAPVPPPSVIAIDRTNWEVLRVPVPNDLSLHQPIYTRSIHENDLTARNRGLFPTSTSAHQIKAPGEVDAQVLEAFEAPVAALADIVLFLPRAIVTRPWQTTRTGLEPYERAPRPSGSVSPVLAEPVRKPLGKGVRPDPAAAPVLVPTGEYRPVPGAAPGAEAPR